MKKPTPDYEDKINEILSQCPPGRWRDAIEYVLIYLPEDVFSNLFEDKNLKVILEFTDEVSGGAMKLRQPEFERGPYRLIIKLNKDLDKRFDFRALAGVFVHELAHFFKIMEDHSIKEEDANFLAAEWGFSDDIETMLDRIHAPKK